MYKPTCFVPETYLPIFTYSSNWADSKFSRNIHQPDIFNFYSLAPTSKQDKEVEHFGPPSEFREIFISQYLKDAKLLMDVIGEIFLIHVSLGSIAALEDYAKISSIIWGIWMINENLVDIYFKWHDLKNNIEPN